MNRNDCHRSTLQIANIRVATELNGLRDRLERVEHGLEAVFIGTDNVPNGTTIGMLQELDVLQQSVGALADYLGRLSELANTDSTASIEEAISVVPLREMAARLSGISTQSGASGKPELF